MQKAVLQKITIIVLMLCLGTSKSLVAQDTLGFKWNLIEVLDPTIETKVVFTPLVPAPAKFTSWDFGDGTTSTTDSIATHSYLPTDTVSVSYNFSLNAKDSTITYKVFANTAAFSEQLDSNTNVTYTRILRSFFNFPVNDPTLLGNMRFEWTINGTILSDVSFSNCSQ